MAFGADLGVDVDVTHVTASALLLVTLIQAGIAGAVTPSKFSTHGRLMLSQEV
jgi:hypothetical protein